MKKLIIIFLLTIVNSYANYVVNGVGNTKGEAYIDAMSKAPSGPHWVISNIYYGPNEQICKITWVIKK